ncbi:MAG: RNA polymerase sigma factor [Ruminococcus sp.]|nr:RNA polymerase sigma factor [Ruminococcus sp.]
MAKAQFEKIYEKYFDTVYRVCFMFFHGSTADTEDAVQTTFLKYLESGPEPGPEEGEHIKAWLIVTASNTCRSMLRKHSRRDLTLDSAAKKSVGPSYSETLDAVMSLPEKERTAVYMCLYEGYTAAQAAKYMGCRENTVHSYIHRARKKLRKQLGE